MIIVVEGPDNSGKSTLAQALKERLGFEVHHPGGKPKDLVEAIDCLNRQARVMQEHDLVNVIFDRLTCISDACYQNRYHKLYQAYRDRIPRGVLIIYCRPPMETILDFKGDGLKPHKSAEAVEFARKNIVTITGRYDALFSMLASIRYDYTCDSVDQLVDLIGGFRD